MGWTPSLAGARRLARPAEDAHLIQKQVGWDVRAVFCGVVKKGRGRAQGRRLGWW